MSFSLSLRPFCYRPTSYSIEIGLGLKVFPKCFVCKNIVNSTNVYGSRRLSTGADVDGSDDYTPTPEYPPILALDPKSTYIRDRDRKLDKIKALENVEDKLIGLNMPRYFGWNSLMLKEGNFPLNFMPFIQHITRTDFIEVDRLPYSNKLSESELNNVINKIRPQLQEAIVIETTKRRHYHELDGVANLMGEGELSNEITKGVVEQINRVLSINLAQHAPHLYEAEIDFEPRIEAFWRVGGFYPDQKTYDERKKYIKDYEKELKTNRFAKRKIEEEPEDFVGHFIQYIGNPVLQLRHSKPLKPLEPQALPATETGAKDATRQPDLSHIPVHRYDPGFYGLEKIRRHGTNIPGFWPGDPNEFGLLSYHSRGHLMGRPPSFGKEDLSNTLSAQAILAGYAWLLGQASYQGFSTFHDITYPITTTSIVTDGRIFSFFASQLNTLLLHDEFIDTNPKVNVCYGLPTLELYQKIEGNDIIGWNDKALRLLVDAYMNEPQDRAGVELKPYLNTAAPYARNIEHEERRVWLHQHFRHLYSNRPRVRLDPEIYDWEMIYKVKFQTRPGDAKRRFFELGIDPFKRRLDDRMTPYIPRKLRDPNNPKKKYKDQFWPDC